MGNIEIQTTRVDASCFNPDFETNGCVKRYNLRRSDFTNAMNDVYEFFEELNKMSVERGWGRFEDMLQLQAISNVLSNLLNNSLAKHSRSLVVNVMANGHPDLIRKGVYPGNSIAKGEEGIEVKSTSHGNVAVDMHSAREQDLCTFVYRVDPNREDPAVPIAERTPLEFTGVFLGHVTEDDYRRNGRGARGTRTATLDADGLARYRPNWLYMTEALREKSWAKHLMQV